MALCVFYLRCPVHCDLTYGVCDVLPGRRRGQVGYVVGLSVSCRYRHLAIFVLALEAFCLVALSVIGPFIAVRYDRYLIFRITVCYCKGPFRLADRVVARLCPVLQGISEAVRTVAHQRLASGEAVGRSLAVCPARLGRQAVAIDIRSAAHAFILRVRVRQRVTVILLAQAGARQRYLSRQDLKLTVCFSYISKIRGYILIILINNLISIIYNISSLISNIYSTTACSSY